MSGRAGVGLNVVLEEQFTFFRVIQANQIYLVSSIRGMARLNPGIKITSSAINSVGLI